jgi:hypothetical protein
MRKHGYKKMLDGRELAEFFKVVDTRWGKW